MEEKSKEYRALETLEKSINLSKEDIIRVSEQADKIVVWLTGFSIAIIALTLNNRDSIIEFNSGLEFKFYFTSGVAIISGVLYRVFFYFYQFNSMKFTLSILNRIDTYKNPIEDYTRKITLENTYQDIIKFMKEDFNFDYLEVKKSNYNPIESSELRENALQIYNELKSKQQNEEGLKINKKISQISGIPMSVMAKQKPESTKSKDRIFKLNKILRNASSLLFLLSCLSFILGIVFFLKAVFEKIV